MKHRVLNLLLAAILKTGHQNLCGKTRLNSSGIDKFLPPLKYLTTSSRFASDQAESSSAPNSAWAKVSAAGGVTGGSSGLPYFSETSCSHNSTNFMPNVVGYSLGGHETRKASRYNPFSA